MMTMTACPTEDELKAFAHGLLPELQSDDLFEHLRGCEICRSQLETVENSEDSLIASLRSPDFQSAFDAEAGCQAALAKALDSLAATRLAAIKDSEADGPAEDRLLPPLIGNYELVRPLGRGGMGHVYLARHNKLGREVALKLLASHRLANPRMKERFENEMRAVGRLSHPNIVTAHDAREIDGTAVLVTEFIDGMDLSQLTNRLGRIPVPDACEIIRQVAIALEYTHQQGFVHRDVKPSNIMLSRQGMVKLLDLGLARWQMDDNQQSELTGTGQTMGTADYVAPEQITDSRHVDIRADIYSLGCTLFKLLTGNAPFADERHLTAFAKMTAHVSTPPPRLADTLPSAAPELSALVDRMLAKEPDQRPSEPMSVAEQLASFSQAASLQALVHRAEASEVAEPTLQPARSAAAEQPLMLRSVPVWSAALGALAALLLGLCLGVLVKIRYPDGTELSLEVPAGSKITQEFINETDPKVRSKLSDNAKEEQLPGLRKDLPPGADDPESPSVLSLDNLQPFSFAILQEELESDSLELDAQRLREMSDPNQPLETKLGTWFPARITLENLPESSFVTQIEDGRYLLVKKDRDSVVPWTLLANNIGINFRGGGRTNTVMEMHFQGPLQRAMRELSTRYLNGYLAMIVNDRIIHVSKIVSPIDRQAVISGQYSPEDLRFLRQALDGGLVDLPELPRPSEGASRETPATLPAALSPVKIQVTSQWPNAVRAGDGTVFQSTDHASQTKQIGAYVQKKLDEGAKLFVLEIDPSARYAVVNRVQRTITEAIGNRPANVSIVPTASSDPFANPGSQHSDDPFQAGPSRSSSRSGNNPFGASGGHLNDPVGGSRSSPGSDPFDGNGSSHGSDPFGGPNKDDPFGPPADSDPFGGPGGIGNPDPFGDSKPAEKENQFTVIAMKSMDVKLAIAAVKKFMGDEDLVIDGDAEKRQLFVRATPERLSKIIAFLETIDKAQSQQPTLGSKISHFEGVWTSGDLAGKRRFRTAIFLIERGRVLAAEVQPGGRLLAKVRFSDFKWDTQKKIIHLPGLVGKTKFLNDDLIQIIDQTHPDPESLLLYRITRELPQDSEDFVQLCQESKCPIDPDSPNLVGFANLWLNRGKLGEQLPSTESRQQTRQEAFQYWIKEWIAPSVDEAQEGVDK